MTVTLIHGLSPGSVILFAGRNPGSFSSRSHQKAMLCACCARACEGTSCPRPGNPDCDELHAPALQPLDPGGDATRRKDAVHEPRDPAEVLIPLSSRKPCASGERGRGEDTPVRAVGQAESVDRQASTVAARTTMPACPALEVPGKWASSCQKQRWQAYCIYSHRTWQVAL